MSFLATCKDFLSFIISPPVCFYCQKSLDKREIFCSMCYASVMPMVTKKLSVTSHYSVTVHVAALYNDPIRSLVLAKHSRNKLASKYLAQLIWSRTSLCYADFDYIIPVPLHWTRYAWRWFNQSEEIAWHLSTYSKKPVGMILKRTKKTAYQSGLSREKRQKNLASAFTLVKNVEKFKDRKLLLVDDVMTTGATLKHCIKILRKVRPKEIVVAVASAGL